MVKDEINIGKLIYDGAANKKAVSSPEFINEFFEDLLPSAKEAWPFDFSKEGYDVSYTSADFKFEQCGMLKCFETVVEVFNDKEKFIMQTVMSLDCEVIQLTLDSIYRAKGIQNNNFGNVVLSKFKKVIDAQDKARGKNPEPSKILIHAASDKDKNGVDVYGGYIWANQGFNFANASELEYARTNFKSFAVANGVEISANDLKLFTKPCHFAAFNCGVRVKNKLGKDSSLGKAFLYLHSWHGHMVASPRKSEKPEEQRYAEAYNNPNFSLPCRKRMALLQLSGSYRKMLKKYRNIHATTQKANPVKLYTRATKMQISKMLSRL